MERDDQGRESAAATQLSVLVVRTTPVGDGVVARNNGALFPADLKKLRPGRKSSAVWRLRHTETSKY